MYRKRHRTTFNQHQLQILEEAFKLHIYPSPSLREAIALQTNLDTSRVQVWFQNRRAKHKRRVSQVSQAIKNFTSYTSPAAAAAAAAVAVAATTTTTTTTTTPDGIIDTITVPVTGPTVATAAAAAAIEAALSVGDDFCAITDQMIAESCAANDMTSCYELYEPLNQFAIHQHHHQQQQQPSDQPQQQQQLHAHAHAQQQHQQQQQQQQQDQEQQQQQQHEPQRQQSQSQERQNQYYNYYRHQIGSLKSTMTEFLQS